MLSGWNAKHTLAALAMLLVFALVLVFFLQRGGGDDDTPEVTSTPTTGEMPTVPPTSAPPENAPLVVAPGKVGAAEAGMTKAQAAATGLFNTDVDGVEGCSFQLKWKKQYAGLDVLTDEQGNIASLGITEGGPKTSAGVGVGSTLAEVQAAYPELSDVAERGFGQAGAIQTLGDDHIGFLFGDTTVESVKPVTKVSFMEVTSGSEPELIRSGC